MCGAIFSLIAEAPERVRQQRDQTGRGVLELGRGLKKRKKRK